MTKKLTSLAWPPRRGQHLDFVDEHGKVFRGHVHSWYGYPKEMPTGPRVLDYVTVKIVPRNLNKTELASVKAAFEEDHEGREFLE